jgi:hypothetical protein
MSRDTDLCPTGLLIGADTFWGKYTIVERVKRYQDIKKEWGVYVAGHTSVSRVSHLSEQHKACLFTQAHIRQYTYSAHRVPIRSIRLCVQNMSRSISSSWLASMIAITSGGGLKFRRCARAHRWLRGMPTQGPYLVFLSKASRIADAWRGSDTDSTQQPPSSLTSAIVVQGSVVIKATGRCGSTSTTDVRTRPRCSYATALS